MRVSMTSGCDAMKTEADDQDQSPEALQKQAWVWLRLINSGDVKTWEADGFKRWLRTSPAHQAAYQEAREQWKVLRPLAGEVLRTDPEVATLRHASPQRLQLGRRAFLGAAVSAAAVAGVAIVHPPGGLWPAPGEWGADVRTATGEQRSVALAAGVVTLNTKTSIRHRPAGGEIPGGIDLLAGEAAIDLRGDRAPFVVTAGRGRSLAEAGRFEVRYLDGIACVTCVEGTVQVEHAVGARTLKTRQQIRYDDNAIGTPIEVLPQIVAAWRNGELVFNNTPLTEVIDEINRYRSGQVVLMNDSVRDRPVVGSFFTASLDQALLQLQHNFGLRARHLPAGLLILT
jgi:transmembrane sensor